MLPELSMIPEFFARFACRMVSTNPLVAWLEGQYGLQRAGSNSCTLWASKWHVETSDHTVLSDADLAEADRQARRIKEELK